MFRKAARRRSGERATVSVLVSESLESRELLAGVVGVSVSSAGDLTVVGDNDSNQVVLQVTAGGIRITGLSGTRLRFQNQTFNAGVPLSLPSGLNVRDISVSLRGGDDSMSAEVDSALTVGRNVSIHTANGNDDLLVSATARLSVNGWLDISTGAGDDSVGILADDATIRVAGSAWIFTGEGNDNVFIGDAAILDSIGTTDEVLAIPNNSGTAAAQAIQFGRDLWVNTGADGDAAALAGVAVQRDATINTGGGRVDNLGITNLWIGRNLTLNYGDDNAIQNVTVNGNLTVRSGGSNDRFAVDRIMVRGDVDIDLGGGNDSMALGASVTAMKKVRISGGAGRDNLLSLTTTPGATIRQFEGTTVDFEAIVDSVFQTLADRFGTI